MENNRNEIGELIELKAALESALDNGDAEEIKAAYDNFKNLYKKITGKEFEEGIEPERLDQINAVINGVSKESITSDDVETELEF